MRNFKKVLCMTLALLLAVSFTPSPAGAKQKTVKKKVSITVFEGGKKTLRCAQLNKAKKVKLSNKDRNCASIRFSKKKAQVTFTGLNEGSTRAYLSVTRKNGKKFKFTYNVKVRSVGSADESDASGDSRKDNKKDKKKNKKKVVSEVSTEAPATTEAPKAKYHYQIKLVNNSKYNLNNCELLTFYIQTDNPDPNSIVLYDATDDDPFYRRVPVFRYKAFSDVNYEDASLGKVEGGYLLRYDGSGIPIHEDGNIQYKLCEDLGKTKLVTRGVLTVVEPDYADTGIRISIKAEDDDQQCKEFIKKLFSHAKEELNITAPDTELTLQQKDDIIQNCADYVRYNTRYPTDYTSDLVNYSAAFDMTPFYTTNDCIRASSYIEVIVEYLGGYAYWNNLHTTTYWFNDTVNTDTAYDWDKAYGTYLELNDSSPEAIEAYNTGKAREVWACPDISSFTEIPKVDPSSIPNHPDCTVTYPAGY